MDCAVSRIAEALSVTARSTPPIAPRNSSTEASMCLARSSRALESCKTCELRLRLRSIASWKIWIARASAPISSARSVWGTSTFSSPSATRLMVAVIERKRPRDRAGDDQDADADHDQRQAAETGQQRRPCCVVDLGLPGDLLAALGIDLGKRLEILVERGTDGAIGVVVAPFAASGGADLDAAANQFLAELDELFDALLEDGELLGIIGLDDGFPVLDHAQDLVVELEQSVAEFLHVGGFAWTCRRRGIPSRPRRPAS